jgi:hypothetical protein
VGAVWLSNRSDNWASVGTEPPVNSYIVGSA